MVCYGRRWHLIIILPVWRQMWARQMWQHKEWTYCEYEVLRTSVFIQTSCRIVYPDLGNWSRSLWRLNLDTGSGFVTKTETD